MAKKKTAQPGTKSDWYQVRAADDDTAEVLIYGDIGETWWSEESNTAKALAEELNGLRVSSLTVRINSYGGVIADGLAIYNAIRRHKATVNVEIDGVAFSAASLIAMAGDTVNMAENAMLMIHAPWGSAAGNADDMRQTADVLDKYAEAMATAYVNDDVTYDVALALLQDGEDHYYTANEALSVGFIDNISKPMDIAASAKAAAFQRHGWPQHITPAASAAFSKPEKTTMADKATKHAPAATDQGQPAGNDHKDNVADIHAAADAKAQARITERNRGLKTAFSLFMADGHQFQAVATAVYQDALADPSKTIEEARADMLARLGEGIEPIGGTHATAATAGDDARDKLRTGVAAVLAHRVGVGQDDRTNSFRGLALHQIAAKCLASGRIDTTGMTKSEIASKVLAAHTTSDFPYLLMDAANKRLQAAYGNFPSTWDVIALPGEVTDFKTVNLIRMGSFNSLDVIPEGGQYTQGTIGEEREQLTPATKGKYIQLSRQMIINDDLNGFSRMAALLGRAAARTVNADVYGVLNNNAALSDGVALFHASHSNLAGTGAAISVATLSAGRAAMRKQKAPGTSATEYLNIMPSVLAVPVTMEDHAKTIVTSDYDTDTAASRKKNPVQSWGPLEVVSDPYLDAASATAWYLIAEPMDAPLIEVHFLDGQQTPFLDTNEEFLTDAVQWKVRLDYGLSANDYRGGYKNAGA